MYESKGEIREKDFQLYLSETRQIVNSRLSLLVSSIPQSRLSPQLEYALLSQGKRLRPILVILSAQSVGGDREQVIPLALAFELLHTATLVHDDIIDGDKLRRGIPALYKKWNVNSAMLAGDAMISLSINLAADFGAEIMKIVSKCGLELCDGEYMDVSLSLSTTNEEEYFLKIRKKAASLFKAAAQCGALAGGGSRLDAACLAEFGECLGIAYQLRDDLLDLTVQGVFIPKDLRTERVTLPLIHLYGESNFNEREILENNLKILIDGNYAGNRAAVKGILSSLKKRGSFAYCEKKMNEYIHKAVISISPLKDTEFKAYLTQNGKIVNTTSATCLAYNPKGSAPHFTGN